MAGVNLNKKKDFVSELKTRIKDATSAVVTQYSGVNVEQITKLRASLRDQGVKFEVIKNKLSIRAVEGTSFEALKGYFKGPTGLAYSSKDPIALAKALKTFSDTQDKFLIQAGVFDGALLDKGQVIELAKVPSREILLSRLVGSMQNSYASMVFVLGAIMRKAEASPAESTTEEIKS